MIPKIRIRLRLLLLPYVGLLWVPFYNFRDPTLFGFPFFYWYQLAWVPAAAPGRHRSESLGNGGCPGPTRHTELKRLARKSQLISPASRTSG